MSNSNSNSTTAIATLSPEQVAAGTLIVNAINSIGTADKTFADAVRATAVTNLPDLASAYVVFYGNVVKCLVGFGQVVDADADATAVGKIIRAVRDSIDESAVGEAATVRDALDTLTGLKGSNQPRFSRAAAIAGAIATADGKGARKSDVTRFVTLHADRTDVKVGISDLARWCGKGAADALPVKVKADTPEVPEVPTADTPEVPTADTPEVPEVPTADTPEVPLAPMSIGQALAAMHRGVDDATLEATIAAAPVAVATLDDAVADALLAALLAMREAQRRADAAVDAVPADALGALGALAAVK